MSDSKSRLASTCGSRPLYSSRTATRYSNSFCTLHHGTFVESANLPGCAEVVSQMAMTSRDMKTSHKGMGIDEDDWTAFLGHVNATLDEFKLPAAEIRRQQTGVGMGHLGRTRTWGATDLFLANASGLTWIEAGRRAASPLP